MLAWLLGAALLLGSISNWPAAYAADELRQRSALSLHTVVPVECTTYFTWQSLGIVYSHKKAGQPGPLTRIVSCTDAQAAAYKDMHIVPSHRVPSLTEDPEHNDVYSAYNKPGAVMYWLQAAQPPEDFILVIDADMIMRQPFDPVSQGAAPGWAVSAFFSYMKGVMNELADKYVPQVKPRDDMLAGPVGRRGDQVGGFTLMARRDLERVAPLWLDLTRQVRNDPIAWNLTGDSYSIHPGDKPWISEMYGYSYACAQADVWHRVDYSAMLYPGYFTTVPPRVLHYGLLYLLEGHSYSFDKHWHYGFDATLCPPWQLTERDNPGGLFLHPPAPAELTTEDEELLRDLLAIQPIIVLNAAFCQRHRVMCPASEQLHAECSKAEALERELDAAFAELEPKLSKAACKNFEDRCEEWAKAGECLQNPGYMAATCKLACGTCRGTDTSPAARRTPAALVQPSITAAETGREAVQQAGEGEATQLDTGSKEQAARSTQLGTQSQDAGSKADAGDQAQEGHDLAQRAGDTAEQGAAAAGSTGQGHAGAALTGQRDAGGATRLRGGSLGGRERGQADWQGLLGHLDPEHAFARDSQAGKVKAPVSKGASGSQTLDLSRVTLQLGDAHTPPRSHVPSGLSGLTHRLGWMGLGLWLCLVAAFLLCLPRHYRSFLRTSGRHWPSNGTPSMSRSI